ncbi:hypothetical protein FRC03_001033 [Tulasnella sp. 419]|nr:hypothetical protein FRC02_011384 [Tulasnella sp. 418]KAG8965005.1 hypothetical protein FRC03_001033 [Tulasnella sp. 419]
MGSQYTRNQHEGEFKGSLVDDTFSKRDMGSEYARNCPAEGDTTGEGGYGGTGDPFTRQNQAHYDRGIFGKNEKTLAEQTPRDSPVDDGERYAGEGIVPPTEAAATQGTSSGTGDQARRANQQYRVANDYDGSNIGG